MIAETFKNAAILLVTLVMTWNSKSPGQQTTVEVDPKQNCFILFPTAVEVRLPNGFYDVRILNSTGGWNWVAVEYSNRNKDASSWTTAYKDEAARVEVYHPQQQGWLRFFITDTYRDDNFGKITVTITNVSTQVSTQVEVDPKQNCFILFPTAVEVRLPNGLFDVRISNSTGGWNWVAVEYDNRNKDAIAWTTAYKDEATRVEVNHPQQQGWLRFFITDTYRDDNFGKITVTITPVTLQEKGWRHERNDIIGHNYYSFSSTVRSEGQFAVKWSSSAAADYDHVLTGNVTGDDKLEIITTNGSTMKIFNSEGTVLRSVSLEPDRSYVTMIEDVNGDGMADIGLGRDAKQFSTNYTMKCFFYDGSGNLIKTFVKPAPHDENDRGMWPVTRLPNGNIVVSEGAGYCGAPRGYAVFNYNTGSEIWHYGVGPKHEITSIADINNDGKLEFSNFAATVHNGVSGDGYNHNGTLTTDDDFYTIVVDEDGNEEFTLGYDNSGGGESSNGSIHNVFVDGEGNGKFEVLVFELHDQIHYPGISQLHLINIDTKRIYRTFNLQYSTEFPGRGTWAIADFNRDGKSEIVATDGSLKQYILDHNLNLLKSAGITGWVELVNNLDGDRNLEIVIRDKATVKVLDANLLEKWKYTFGGEINRIVVSDNDNNGRNELVVLAKDKIYVLEGPGNTQVSNNASDILHQFTLSQNYPNPFLNGAKSRFAGNPETEIRYQLPEPTHVTIKIFNANGQEIRTLVDEEKRPGSYTVRWDGRNSFGKPTGSGLYFYTLRAGEFRETRKALLLR